MKTKMKKKKIKGYALVCKGYKDTYFLTAFDNKNEAEMKKIETIDQCLKGDGKSFHKIIPCEIILIL